MTREEKRDLMLKAFSAYLPHGVWVKFPKYEYPFKLHITGGLCHSSDPSFCTTDVAFALGRGAKPVVYPMSKITQIIEHKGEKFFPLEKLKEDWNYIFFDESENDLVYAFDVDTEKEGWKSVESGVYLTASYGLNRHTPSWVRDKLVEWGFDVYGLLEHDLAIEKE